jgi:probable LLM family oxidoreductase
MKQQIEIGIDSFAALFTAPGMPALDGASSIAQLLDRIEHADRVGLDVFGIGEHHRKDMLDAANTLILAAAAARTKRIRLTSAVTVLSAADPVRVFQQFATLDLISNGRAEMVVGRGSSIEAFPLFGYRLEDYDELFTEKLDLLLNVRANEFVTWSGRFRPAILNLPVYPRPVQQPLPVWIGVGGTPSSFARAGRLGLPLMVAIIGGETHRFRPLVDKYREAWLQAGHPEDQMRVGLHSFGYVADTREEALEDFWPGYYENMSRIGRERGWSPITRAQYDAQTGPTGAFLIGTAEDVAEKIDRHSRALGGINRFCFMMENAVVPNDKIMHTIELIGQKVKPMLGI